MALSFVEVNPTSGGQTTYSNINLQFVSTADIFVTVKKADGEVITLTTDQYTVTTSPSLTVTITDSAVHTVIATNDTIRIFRDTNVSAPARIFSNGSVLKSSDLNANHNQILFAQQENDELGIGDALQKDASGAFWDATSLNIRNVADAVESKDAVTLGQVNAALVSAGSVPSVPQSYSTASGTLSSGAFAGGNTTFAMTPPPTSEFAQTFIVEIDGVIQRPNNDYTVVTGTTTGTLTILGADVTSNSIVVTNFGLSRQVFDFPTTGTATTSTTTPITLQGHSSQSVCIFLVEQSDGDDIFCVNNDHVRIDGRGSTSPLIVKQNVDGNTNIVEYRNAANQVVHRFRDPTEASGTDEIFYEIIDNNTVNAGADVMFKLNRAAVNDGNNNERGNMVEIEGNTGAANGSSAQTVFTINQNGKIKVSATDDVIATAEDANALLTLRSEGAGVTQPCPYLSMRDNANVQRHSFGISSSTIGGGSDEQEHEVIIGHDDPTGDNSFQLRSGATPSGDDVSGTGAATAYWRFFLNGNKAGSNRHGLLTMNAMAAIANTAINIRRVTSDADDSKAVELCYDGKILINDACTGRTKGTDAVLRKDEVAKAAGITLCTHNTPSGVDLVTRTVSTSGTTTTSDTSTYTIVSNNPQLTVTESSGVVTVSAGTYLLTYSVDAFSGGHSKTLVTYTLELLKDGAVVAKQFHSRNSHDFSGVGFNTGKDGMNLRFSELITTTGNTTYQLRGSIEQHDNGATGETARIKTFQKSIHIQHLGES